MSNYPVGVSGSEPQIAGNPVGGARVKCNNMLDAAKVRFLVDGDVNLYSLSDYQDEIDCPFEGRIEVEYVGEDAVGKCPLCGNDIWIALNPDRHLY